MTELAGLKSPRIFPAIDLRGGRCVRLVRGARDAEIHYGDDPALVARRWKSEGACCLHVIDLGAALGEADSTATVLEIAAAVSLPIQVGGGIRDEGRVLDLLQHGASRVIIGTRALRDPEFLRRCVESHGPDRVMVSVDCQGERIKISGWEEESPLGIEEALRMVEGTGVTRVLVTATDRDGTLSGPRADLVARVLDKSSLRVVAAGGIGSLEHIESLLSLAHPRLEGVVVGRALYDGRVRLRDALKLTGEV
jgi:phosphoribosylformimino-5-aminoimidazole carboxamide ribotide isomerase